MRRVGWILVVLSAVLWVAVEMPSLVPAGAASGDPWRRTADGWERADWLRPDDANAPLRLHPLGLAMLQVLLSVGGFALIPSSSPASSPRGGSATATPPTGVPSPHAIRSRPPVTAP